MSFSSLPTPAPSRLFYPLASLILLLIALFGFRFFYFGGQAFPGRPLTPPLRSLVIIHGVLMALWMLLAVGQPLLVATGKKRLHMALGRVGAGMMVLIFIVEWQLGISAARVNPPDLRLFGMNQLEFLAVPTLGVTFTAGFVAVGVWQRRRPEIHRPMMLMASVSAVAAALGRIPFLSAWAAGTWWETLFGAFTSTVLLGLILVALKCLLERRMDRWLTLSFGALVASSVAISLVAKTAIWSQFATFPTSR